MRRWLLTSYIGLAAFVLAILVIPLSVVFARAERERLVAAVERDATVTATLVEDALEHGESLGVQATLEDYQQRTGGRIVVVNTDGTSVADSDQEPGRAYGTRPEVAGALDGDVTSGSRYSATLQEGLLYVAVPVASGGTIHGAVRITYPTAALDSRIRRAWLTLGGVAVVVLAAAAVVGVLLSRSVTRPITRLTEGSHRMAEGELDVHVQTGGPQEIRTLGAAFNSMAARLGDLVAAQQAFVADASHQLRSPLAALRLRLENLEDTVAAGAKPELDAAIAEAMRLSRLVDGLLTLTRAGHQRLVDIDVPRVLDDRAQAWEPLASEDNVRFDVRSESVYATAVDGAIEQILDNLIANALAVAPPGSVVRLSADHHDDEVRIDVIDQGPGMSPPDRARAVDRFWRGSADGEGFGLGLSIAARLAEASGGSLSLHDAVGGGLDVTVRLPLVRRHTRVTTRRR